MEKNGKITERWPVNAHTSAACLGDASVGLGQWRGPVDFHVTDAAGGEAEDAHRRTLVGLQRVEGDERLVAVTLDAARLAAAVGEHFAHVVHVTAHVDGHSLRELAGLHHDLPVAETILGRSGLDETQFRVAGRFLLVSGPRPRSRSFAFGRVQDRLDASFAQCRVIFRYFGVHQAHRLVTTRTVHHVIHDAPVHLHKIKLSAFIFKLLYLDLDLMEFKTFIHQSIALDELYRSSFDVKPIESQVCL